MIEVTIQIREDQDRWTLRQWELLLTGALRGVRVKPESVDARRRFV